jgi:enamine deaminase RidA (YjgF/YER057c/UK114 family)
MMRENFSSGSSFETEFAYSRAVVVGNLCFVAGTTGYDYTTMTLPEDVASQAENTLANIDRALQRAGFSLHDIVRVVIYLTDAGDAPAIAPVLRHWLGEVRPANTTVIAQLMRPEMKVEIEATAAR